MTEELRLNPLSVASADDLAAELASRFPQGLIIAGLYLTPGQEKCETFFFNYYHGLTVCMGLAERAKARLTDIALTPSDYEERE